MSIALPLDLQVTLVAVACVMDAAKDDWWIIASAAIALHGAGPVEVGDVDVLLSPRDARAILPRIGVEAATGTGTDLFKSDIFGRWTEPRLAVEFMAGFRVRGPAGWVEIAPKTRERVVAAGAILFIPAKGELKQMLESFGRPKDLARASLL